MNATAPASNRPTEPRVVRSSGTSPERSARPRAAPAIHPIAHYVWHSLLATLRDWSFLAFVVAMPTTMYLFFAGIYGDQITEGGARVAAVMMVTMATYGALGAAMAAGAQIQTERATGWFRQLMVTSLTPRQFIVGRVIVAAAVVTPAVAVVFLAGAARGVRLPVAVWLASGSLVQASLLPMVVLGLVLGLWFRQAAAGAATTLVMLALSMVGGLWFPLDMMPKFMQAIGRLLPSYWAGRIGVWPVAGGEFPIEGVLVISVWAVLLVALGALGYRRALRSSRR